MQAILVSGHEVVNSVHHPYVRRHLVAVVPAFAIGLDQKVVRVLPVLEHAVPEPMRLVVI